jgi:hypothetical protein
MYCDSQLGGEQLLELILSLGYSVQNISEKKTLQLYKSMYMLS